MNDSFDMSNVAEWITGVTSKNDQVCDFVTAWLLPDMTRMDLFFYRSKSLIFVDAINDSVFFYSKSVNYLNALREFSNAAGDKRKTLKNVSLRMLHNNY
jgi:hypothetical protein